MNDQELLEALAPEIARGAWTITATEDGFAGESPARRRRVSVCLQGRLELTELKAGVETWIPTFRTECPRGPDGGRELLLWGVDLDPARALGILRDWLAPEDA